MSMKELDDALAELKGNDDDRYMHVYIYIYNTKEGEKGIDTTLSL